MKVLPLHKRWLVFEVPYKQKIEGSILYTPNSHRDSIHGAQKVWLIAAPPERTNADLNPGDCCYIQDGFDLLETDFDLWEELKDEPHFKNLKDYVERVDGVVRTKLVADGSLLAVEEH